MKQATIATDAAIQSHTAPHLQRACACGASKGVEDQCPTCAAQERLGVQPKLTVNKPGDRYEQEADRIADRVVSGSGVGPLETVGVGLQRMEEDEEEVQRKPAGLQRQEEEEEDDTLQMKAAGSGAATHAINQAAAAVSSGGAPLSRAERGYFEPRLGRDLSDIRVHDSARAGAAAKGINARAYTLKNNVAFAPGHRDFASTEGRRLMAHELVHTAQQGAERPLKRKSAVSRRIQSPTIQRAPPKNGMDKFDFDAPSGDPEAFESATPTVQRIKIACSQGYIVLETTNGPYIYNMREPGSCDLVGDEFPARVDITGSAITLTPSPAKLQELQENDQKWDAGFKVRFNQENPITLLKGQSSVVLQYVESVPEPTGQTAKPDETDPARNLTCLKSFPNKRFVEKSSSSGSFFKKPVEGSAKVFSLKIPLGSLGWADVEGNASYKIDAGYKAEFGPGDATDICLVTQSPDPATGMSALPPEYQASAGMAKRIAEGKAVFGGQAKFKLPADLIVQAKATGKVKVGLDYLSVVELASVAGELTARGTGRLKGALEATGSVIWDQETGEIEIDTEAALAGAAHLSVKLDASMSATLAGFNLWSQTWNIADARLGVGWEGSVGYSTREGLSVSPGEFKPMDAQRDIFLPQSVGDPATGDEADMDGDKVMDQIFDESRKGDITNKTSEGTENDPHPFTWHKPFEMYEKTVDLPNAERPPSVSRTDGVTDVYWYPPGRKSLSHLKLGVSDWPSSMSPPFKYRPYVGKRGDEHMPNQAKFNRRLDSLGFDRTGNDAEHVWDVGLRGPDFDKFSNLWPAESGANQSAGGKHKSEINTIKQMKKETTGSDDIVGDYLKITGLAKT